MAEERKEGVHRSVPSSAEHSTSRESQPGGSREGALRGTTKEGEDELMEIRKSAGAIAEVIEPVQRTRPERTNP